MFELSLVAVVGILSLGLLFVVSKHWRDKWFALVWGVFFSWFVDWGTRGIKENWMRKARIRGKVLDIGSGNGINLKYFSMYKSKIDSITCVEPNVSLHSGILKRSKELDLPVELFSGTFETFAAQNPLTEFDSITVIYVLCTVDNAEQVINGIYSKLKPGGTLALLEHIKETQNTFLNIMQILFQPVQYCYGGGCNIRRVHDSTLKKYKFEDITEEYASSYKLGMVWLTKFYTFIGTKHPNVPGEPAK